MELTWQNKILIESKLASMAIEIAGILEQLGSMTVVKVEPRYPLPPDDLDISEETTR